jgi:hypothetical protein
MCGLLIFICCLFPLLGQYKTDTFALQHNRAVINEINTMPLHKLWFTYDSESQSMKWDYVVKRFPDSYEVAYLDTEGRVRKYIYQLSEEDNSWNIVCYYDEEGQLVFFIGRNSATASGRYNAQDFSENIAICSNGKKIILQDIKRSFRKNGDEEFQVQRNKCSKCKFPTHLGDMNIQPFTSVSSLTKHFGLNTKTIDWKNSTVVTFGGISDSTVSWSVVIQNDVKIFSQPNIESEVLIIVDAGHSVSAYPPQPIKQIENEICTMWYRVNYNGQDYGYIDSRFLEPVEKEVKK